MHDLRAKGILETEKNLVQSRINVTVSRVGSFHIFLLFYVVCVKITGYILRIYKVRWDTRFILLA